MIELISPNFNISMMHMAFTMTCISETHSGIYHHHISTNGTNGEDYIHSDH